MDKISIEKILPQPRNSTVLIFFFLICFTTGLSPSYETPILPKLKRTVVVILKIDIPETNCILNTS